MASDLNFNFICSDNSETLEYLPKELEILIDEAISRDFKVYPLIESDRQNDMYKAFKFALSCSHTAILYERKVISDKAPVIPREQFIFGFRPTEGLCIFAHKKEHKEMLCDSPIRELSKVCFLTQSLQYALVEADNFRVWSYLPVCCSNDTCPAKARDLEMRQTLFS
jgi:hypothetical protein